MKKKKEIEVTVCDLCGKEGHIRKCEICGKEVCGDHWYNINGNVRIGDGNVWDGHGVYLLVCYSCLRNNPIAVLNKLRLKIRKIQEEKLAAG